MQQAGAGFQSRTDGGGGEWRVADDARALLGSALAAALARDERGAPLRAVKLSARREVWAADVAGLPPLLIKRYPARRGVVGPWRDRLRQRGPAELAMAQEFERCGLLTPRALAAWSAPATRPGAPSWFVGVRLLGVETLGRWLERRFRPGDGATAKRSIVRRALALLARIHEAGLWHGDFHGGNLLLHDAEGPAAALYSIDLHGAQRLGSVPPSLRARDAADLLHSLRYAFSPEELAELAGDATVERALDRKRRAHARSRAARAFVESSRFGQSALAGGATAWHDRSAEPAALERWLAAHATACESSDGADERLLRRGAKSVLTLLPDLGGAVVVKEFRGRGAVARAKAAFGHGVAAQVRDLPVAAPLAAIELSPRRAVAIARAVVDALPLHLAAHEARGGGDDRARVAAVAARAGELLAALVSRRFVHPDLSLKNLLLRWRDGAPELAVVDLDAARPDRAWTTAQLERALAQLGDLPRTLLSGGDRWRFVRTLLDATGRKETVAALLRASGRRLARRRHLPAQGAPRHDLVALPSLHLFGNWKWTGPAEPAVALARAFPGAPLLLGPGPAGPHEQQVADHARARGVACDVVKPLRKHWNPLRTGRSAAAVAPRAAAAAPATIVVHLDSDHAVARRVAERLAQRPAVLRCVHEHGGRALLSRRLLASAELLVAPTRGLAQALEAALARPPFDVGVLETGVDRDRFRSSAERRAKGRARLGLQDDAVAFGIVARIQRHRRFELLLDAWSRLKSEANPPRLVILGRGTHETELVHEPIARRGLGDCVSVPGYQEGEAYVESLAACDAGLFLVPGTDVSCRAVREWMAMARPVVALRRAPLPELIDHDVDGWLVDEQGDALARAVRSVAQRERLAAAGRAAAAKAALRFEPARVAEQARALARMAALAVPGTALEARLAASVVAAVRPGRLAAALAVARRDGIAADDVVALDPARSRDALLDVVTVARRTRPRLLLVEPSAEWDATAAASFRRIAPECFVLREAGGARDGGGALARRFPAIEA